jgi:hypothetical protein
MASLNLEPKGNGFYYLSNGSESVTLLWRENQGIPQLATWATVVEEVDVVLFLAIPSAKLSELDLVELRSQLLTLRQSPAYSQVKVLWLHNPGDSLSQWRFQSLSVGKSDSNLVVSRLATFDLGGYSLALPSQSVIQPTDTALTITAPHAYMSTGYGAYRLNGVGNVRLSLEPQNMGCWKFSLTLQRPEKTEIYQELAALDIGFRLFYPDPFFSTMEELTDPSTPQVYQSQRYPLFDETASGHSFYQENITLWGQWDPLNDGVERTFFELTGQAFTQDAIANPFTGDAGHAVTGDAGHDQVLVSLTPSIPSGYRTNLGYTVYLTPQHDSRLVFAAKPGSSLEAPQGRYLVPQGEFILTVPPHQDNSQVPPPEMQNLMCGLSGVEYIRLAIDYELEFRKLETTDQLPDQGRRLIVVAKIEDTYHLRIFAEQGQTVFDQAKSAFSPDSIFGLAQATLEEIFNQEPLRTAATGDAIRLEDVLTGEELIKQKGVLLQKITAAIHYSPYIIGFEPGHPAFAPHYTPVLELTKRLRCLLVKESAETSRFSPFGLLVEILGTNQSNDIYEITKTLLREFFPIGTQLALDSNKGEKGSDAALVEAVIKGLATDGVDALKRFSHSNIATLRQFEQWFQELLRASRVQKESTNQPIVAQNSSDAEDSLPVALTNRTQSTTAWSYVKRSDRGSLGPTYYAQPDQSILYKSTPSGLLSFLEVPATELNRSALPDGQVGAFPLFPYGSVKTALTDCRQMELQVVNPLRRAKIQQHYETPAAIAAAITEADSSSRPELARLMLAVETSLDLSATSDVQDVSSPELLSETETPEIQPSEIQPSEVQPSETQPPKTQPLETKQGTTPQGLLASFTLPKFDCMTELILARSKDPRDQDQYLKFTDIPRGSSLWSALRANELMLVVDDATSLTDYFNDPDNLSEINTQLTIAGWTFYFDAVDDAGKPRWQEESVLIFKYNNRSLLELIDQPSAWSQTATFVGDATRVEKVRKRIRTMLENAIAKDMEGTDPKTRKRYAPLANIARNPAWSGIIGLNIPVPPSEGLPPELKALAGGIKEEKFFAQYVGINDTPVRPYLFNTSLELASELDNQALPDVLVEQFRAEGYALSDSKVEVIQQNRHWIITGNDTKTGEDRKYLIRKEKDVLQVSDQEGSLVAEPSSLFGLIDYEDDEPPAPNESGYNFQMLSLRVLFENSLLIDFASEIAVTVDKLFKERTQLQEDGDAVQYTLELISVARINDMPQQDEKKSKKQLIIVAQIGEGQNPVLPPIYHVRIFNKKGETIVDKGQGQFIPDSELTQQLQDAFANNANRGGDRELIQSITTNLGHNISGRNLIKLQGTAENHNGKTTYAFSFSGNNRFMMPNSAIFNYIDVVKAQFASDPVVVYDLVLTSLQSGDQLTNVLPGKGKSLVFVVKADSSYHARIFDPAGNILFGEVQATQLSSEQLSEDDRNLFENSVAGQAIKLGKKEKRNFVKRLFKALGLTKADENDQSNEEDSPMVTGRFSFWTQLGFRKIEKFDAFSFGPSADLPTEDDVKYNRFLRASNLVVSIKFPLDDPTDRTFEFISKDLTFQPVKPGQKITESSFRPTSLYAKFPFTLKGFIEGNSKPKGYLPVKTSLGNVSLSGDWYGMSFDLDLGSLGALSSVMNLVTSVVILWLPNTDLESTNRPDPQVYVGIKLPGLTGEVLGFSLQSVLKLSFKSAQFLFDPSDKPENSTYLLKLKAIVIKLLVLSLPPNAQTELLLFGNSKGRDQPIGWYAAYAKEPPKDPQKAPPARTQ